MGHDSFLGSLSLITIGIVVVIGFVMISANKRSQRKRGEKVTPASELLD